MAALWASANPASAVGGTTTTTTAPQPQIYGTITLNTKYTDVPPPARQLIDDTFVQYKKPMTDGLAEIALARPTVLKEISQRLEQTRLAALKIENKLEQFRHEAERLRDDAKQQHRDIQRHGRNGIQPSNKQTLMGNFMNEDLPIEFFRVSLQRLEQRLLTCTEEADRFTQQLHFLSGDVATSLTRTDQYGQRTRIGMQDIVKLLQSQNESFVRLAASVAETHGEMENLRSAFLKLHCKGGMNPFHAADRDDAARQRKLISKLNYENDEGIAQAPVGSTSAAPAAPAGFGGFAAAAPTPSAGGFTGFGAPAPAQASGFSGFGAPAPAPSSGFSGFGAPAPAPSSGFSGFGASAPAPSSTGGFGFAAPAPAPAATGSFAGFGTSVASPAPAAGGFGGFAGLGGAPTAPAAGAGFPSLGAPAVGGLFGDVGANSPRPVAKAKSKKK
jgi:hypothetical protein